MESAGTWHNLKSMIGKFICIKQIIYKIEEFSESFEAFTRIALLSMNYAKL